MSVRAASKRAKAAAKGSPDSPRSQVLPGMGRKRVQALDNICESLSTIRRKMAKLREDEADDVRAALSLMKKNDRTSYQHAGVEMARVPGEEKLRVRTTKADATAEVEEETPAAAEAEEPDESGGDAGDANQDGDGDVGGLEDLELP